MLTQSNTSVKRMCASAHSMGNKQDELKTCMQSQGFDLIAITETWWDSSCDWNVVIKERQTRKAGWWSYPRVRQHLECIELCLGVDDELMRQDKRAD